VIEGPIEGTVVVLGRGSHRSRELMRRIFDLVEEAGGALAIGTIQRSRCCSKQLRCYANRFIRQQA